MALAPPSHATGHYHLHLHTISKLKGHDIRAAAAYRRAELFAAEKPASITEAAAYRRAQQLGNDGQVFDYRRKVGVAWTGLFAPPHTPAALLDPQTLWNTVERLEHRANARLGRELIIALPHQVSQEVHIAMLRAFIMANLVSRGMVADVAIHRPPVEHGGDPRNWHAHVLLTDRPMTASGFAATKDRSWNAKENVILWRKAWAETHNAAMQALGMPHRIDHRSLEAQRRDAIQRGDVVASLDLDRTPQIHVGKAAYGQHPRRTAFRDRRERNRIILDGNKSKASANAARMQRRIARTDTAAHDEARINAYVRDTWAPETASYEELHAAYGRPPATTTLSKLKEIAFNETVSRRAMELSRRHHHPWHPAGNRPGAPSMLDILRPMVKDTGPGNPMFTVTAKDIAFAFYAFGFSTREQLQKSLENIALEEQRLFADRIAKKPALRPPPRLPKAKPPKLPTPQAELLQKYRKTQPSIDAIYVRRLEQLNAYNERHIAKTQRKCQKQANYHGHRLARAMTRRAPLFDLATADGAVDN